MRPPKKRIRVFWSSLSNRFYASRNYREIKPGIYEVTGDRDDVSSDICAMVVKHGITFKKVSEDEGLIEVAG